MVNGVEPFLWNPEKPSGLRSSDAFLIGFLRKFLEAQHAVTSEIRRELRSDLTGSPWMKHDEKDDP